MHFILNFLSNLFDFMIFDALERRGVNPLVAAALWILGIGALIGVMYLITLVVPESPFR